MRTSLDVPDELFRHLKTRAASEGSTLRDLILDLVERGMTAETPADPPAADIDLPSISLGAPMALPAAEMTNAKLAQYLDE